MNPELLIFRLLPTFFRTAFWIGWLRTLLFPVQGLGTALSAFRSVSFRELKHNPSTLVLEQYLREETGIATLTITNLSSLTNDFLLSPSLFQQDFPLMPPIGEGAILRFGNDPNLLYLPAFRVNAPSGSAKENLIRNLLDQYVHASFTYEIDFA